MEYAVASAPGLSPGTHRTYRTSCRALSRWANERGTPRLTYHELTLELASEFKRYLSSTGMRNNTLNSYLDRLGPVTRLLQELDPDAPNPWRKVKRVPHTQGRRQGFTDAEAARLQTYIRRHDRGLYLFTLFIRLTFMRPNEVRHIQIKYLDLANLEIIIPGSVSKNRKLARIAMPKVLRNLLKQMQLEQFPPDWYLFGRTLIAGVKPCAKNQPYNRHRRAMVVLGLTGTGETLYSWKDTGALEAKAHRIGVEDISRQMRHHSYEMTELYLKRLGGTPAAAFRDFNPLDKKRGTP